MSDGLVDNVEEEFDAATAFVQSGGASGLPQPVLLQLYGYYKQAVEGPCKASRPRPWQPGDMSKWTAWHSNGEMPRKEAMRAYVHVLTSSRPDWRYYVEREEVAGPVFSSLANSTPEDGQVAQTPRLHELAASGAISEIRSLLDRGEVGVDDVDEEGRTALHWAVDHGHLPVVHLLLDSNANVNKQDCEDQTPLHYAAICEHEEIARVLLGAGANPEIRDDMGQLPKENGPKWWTLWKD